MTKKWQGMGLLLFFTAMSTFASFTREYVIQLTNPGLREIRSMAAGVNDTLWLFSDGTATYPEYYISALSPTGEIGRTLSFQSNETMQVKRRLMGGGIFDEGFVMIGYETQSSDWPQVLYLHVIDWTGQTIIDTTYDEIIVNSIISCQVRTDSGIVIGAMLGHLPYVVKIDGNASITQAYTMPVQGEYGNVLDYEFHADNSLLVTGWSRSTGSTTETYSILVDSNEELVWSSSISGYGGDQGGFVHQLADSSVMIGGLINSYPTIGGVFYQKFSPAGESLEYFSIDTLEIGTLNSGHDMGNGTYTLTGLCPGGFWAGRVDSDNVIQWADTTIILPIGVWGDKPEHFLDVNKNLYISSRFSIPTIVKYSYDHITDSIIPSESQRIQSYTLKLYPNPTNAGLVVRFPLRNEIIVLRIVDIKGRVVREMNTQNVDRVQLDFSDLESGVYVALAEGSSIYQGKFLLIK